MKRPLRLAAIGVAAVLLLTLPLWVANSYYINIASQILLWAVAALALNVLVGYGGLVSLGHAGPKARKQKSETADQPDIIAERVHAAGLIARAAEARAER